MVRYAGGDDHYDEGCSEPASKLQDSEQTGNSFFPFLKKTFATVRDTNGQVRRKKYLWPLRCFDDTDASTLENVGSGFTTCL